MADAILMLSGVSDLAACAFGHHGWPSCVETNSKTPEQRVRKSRHAASTNQLSPKRFIDYATRLDRRSGP
jgi:hypothetical protein